MKALLAPSYKHLCFTRDRFCTCHLGINTQRELNSNLAGIFSFHRF